MHITAAILCGHWSLCCDSGCAPAGEVLLVGWLSEPVVEQHNGSEVAAVPDAPPDRLV